MPHTALPEVHENFMFSPFFPLLLLLTGVVLEYSGLDLWWISHFYDFQTQSWPFKHHWLFDALIHTGGQWFVKAMVMAWLAAFMLTFFQKRMRVYRKILIYFLAATATGPILISLGKQFTHVYTPWDLQLFRGNLPYIRLFDHVPPDAPVGHAFPAGHAAGGYAFLSLYFLLFHFRSPYRINGLLFGLCLGFVFGLGQQIRGAHFPSHDLFSLAICWLAALQVYFLFYPHEWRTRKR